MPNWFHFSFFFPQQQRIVLVASMKIRQMLRIHKTNLADWETYVFGFTRNSRTKSIRMASAKNTIRKNSCFEQIWSEVNSRGLGQGW